MEKRLTVGSKDISALEIIPAKKLIPYAVFKIHFCQVMNIKIYIAYNEHEIKKLLIKTKKNDKHYYKYLNNFSAHCMCA